MAENNEITRRTLRDIRKMAGYKSAKAFAKTIGIPVTTYTKYEKEIDGPNKPIPLRRAWEIADALDTTIDNVVGRLDVPPRGRIQQFYESLSNANKARMDQFMDYLVYLEETEPHHAEFLNECGDDDEA